MPQLLTDCAVPYYWVMLPCTCFCAAHHLRQLSTHRGIRYQKIYSNARSRGRDLERHHRNVIKRELARPPLADSHTEQLLMMWNRYLDWEKDNPLNYTGAETGWHVASNIQMFYLFQ